MQDEKRHPAFNNGCLRPKLTVPLKISAALYSRLDETIRESRETGPARFLRRACRLNRHTRHESLQSINGEAGTAMTNRQFRTAPVYFSNVHGIVKNLHRFSQPHSAIASCFLRHFITDSFLHANISPEKYACCMAFPTTSSRMTSYACDCILRSVRQKFFTLPFR